MKYALYFMVLLLFAAVATAQFKTQAETPNVSQSLVRPTTSIGNFLGLLNMQNLRMTHNFSLSYMTFGGTGLSLASYTNSIFYKISDPLYVRMDVTLQGSPFAGSLNQSALSGIFLSRAELSYKPWENFLIKFEYNHLPMDFYGRFNPWYNPYSSSFWDNQ